MLKVIIKKPCVAKVDGEIKHLRRGHEVKVSISDAYTLWGQGQALIIDGKSHENDESVKKEIKALKEEFNSSKKKK